MLRPPFEQTQAISAVSSIAGGRIDNPTHSLDPTKRQQLANIAVRLGEPALEIPAMAAVDIDPILVTQDGLVAVDALVVLAAVAETYD
jgi:acetyltransferase